MKNSLLYPSYFPSVSHYMVMMQSDNIVFEVEDNYQKQTNRNRMYIYSPNGVQLLNIPIKHSNIKHQKTKDVQLETAFDWQKQHFKSLEAAYRSSPFFEYFEDDILPIFQKKQKFLLDLNFEVFDIVNSCLGIELSITKTSEYFNEVNDIKDFRGLINGKKDTTQHEPYTQVFGDKHGFLSNLSILDLLFNEGRYAVDYLKEQKF